MKAKRCARKLPSRKKPADPFVVTTIDAVDRAIVNEKYLRMKLAQACILLERVLRCEDVHTDHDWMQEAAELVEEF